MRKIIALALFTIMLTCAPQAVYAGSLAEYIAITIQAPTAAITFEWDEDPTNADLVIEYVFYQAIGPNADFVEIGRIPYDDPDSVEVVTVTIGSGRHFFYVTARSAFGESDASNIVEIQTSSPKAKNLRVRGVQLP